ncbi:hypothetical protein Q4491_17495 [Photobacterium sp. 2_MG-2023]|uniref:hypothetical protein n=1 Tax=Photobacterium sp. 2_MG-2023 TaxID=3062663 RepID=UPI0026E25203|nr:hypothetical protein [Photobacterium sp. 2_MG-2023]MDO6583140.1 hypothetical protein [Photobacterium sp. 2_MG-2023]
MESLLSLFFRGYLILGAAATLYVIVYFFLSGLTLFDQGKKRPTPLRYQCSYIFIMCLMMPVFYLIFIEEILSLPRHYQAQKQKTAKSYL